MTAPTVLDTDSTVFNTATATKTVTLDIQAGCRVAVGVSCEDSGTTFTALPTNDGTALTWTPQAAPAGASNTTQKIWTTTGDTTRTIVVTITRGGTTTNHWGAAGISCTGSSGIGVQFSVAGDTTADFSATATTSTDSLIFWLWGDWTARAAARTYLTATAGAFTAGNTLVVDGTLYATQWGYHANAGAGGSKIIGVSAPASQDFSLSGIEILGSSGTTNATVDTGALTLTGQDVTVAGSGSASATTDIAALTLTGVTPTLAGSGTTNVTVDTAILSLSGQDVIPSFGAATVAVDPASLVLAGQDVSPIPGSASVAVDTAALTLSGQDVGAAGVSAVLDIDPAALTLTGVDVTAVVPIVIDVDPAVLSLSGQDVTVSAGSASVTVDPAVLMLTGVDPVVSAGLVVDVDTAILSLTGVDVTTTAAPVTVAVDPAALLLTGVDVSAASSAMFLDVDTALLLLSGQEVAAVASGEALVDLDSALLTLSGQTPTVTGGTTLHGGVIGLRVVRVNGRMMAGLTSRRLRVVSVETDRVMGD